MLDIHVFLHIVLRWRYLAGTARATASSPGQCPTPQVPSLTPQLQQLSTSQLSWLLVQLQFLWGHFSQSGCSCGASCEQPCEPWGWNVIQELKVNINIHPEEKSCHCCCLLVWFSVFQCIVLWTINKIVWTALFFTISFSVTYHSCIINPWNCSFLHIWVLQLNFNKANYMNLMNFIHKICETLIK